MHLHVQMEAGSDNIKDEPGTYSVKSEVVKQEVTDMEGVEGVLGVAKPKTRDR